MFPLSVGSGRRLLKNPSFHSKNVNNINNNNPVKIAKSIIHNGIGSGSFCTNKSTLAVVST